MSICSCIPFQAHAVCWFSRYPALIPMTRTRTVFQLSFPTWSHGKGEEEQGVLRLGLSSHPGPCCTLPSILATVPSECSFMEGTRLGDGVPLPRPRAGEWPGWNLSSDLYISVAQALPPLPTSCQVQLASTSACPSICFLQSTLASQPGCACSRFRFPSACHTESQLLHAMLHRNTCC